MNNNRWIIPVAALVLAAVVGVFAYNAGIAHGIVQSGKLPAMTAPYPYPYPYMWHPWGFGFGFFLIPLFFIFWIVLMRAAFWGGRWRHGRCGGYGFEEWHRQAHERMNGGTPRQ